MDSAGAGNLASASPLIQVTNLTKAFNGRPVLKGVDLVIGNGEFVTIVGPNGAGKTTLLRILSTLSRPSSGKVTVRGIEMGKDSNEIRRCIGYVPHQTLLYDDLTAYENLKFYARMYDVPDREQRINYLAEQMGLSSRLHQMVRTLSRGTQQRLSIVRALLHDPAILLLDEPETGLDQEAVALLIRVLHTADRTVIMTSHHLERGIQLCDRVIILASGRIAYEGSKESMNLADFADLYIRCTELR